MSSIWVDYKEAHKGINLEQGLVRKEGGWNAEFPNWRCRQISADKLVGLMSECGKREENTKPWHLHNGELG